MEEKLEEIIQDAEERLDEIERTISSLKLKMAFLKDHKFHREHDWILAEYISKHEIYSQYKKTVEEIRGLLNLWNS